MVELGFELGLAPKLIEFVCLCVFSNSGHCTTGVAGTPVLCFYNRALRRCQPSVGQVARAPVCKALFVTLLMGSSLPPWEGCRVPLKVPGS